ncbi:MAG: endonuclease/exonuclease/phosphatase family protein [Cyanobacteria bacterium P01_A01_bin.135]
MPRHRSHSTLAWLLAIAIAALTAIGLGATALGWPHYLELLSHFQVQYLAVSLVLLVTLLSFNRQLPFWLGLFCCVALAMPVVSWYVPDPGRSPEASDLRVLVANLNAKNQRYELVSELVAQQEPDLAVFMEVDLDWQTQLDASIALPHTYREPTRSSAGVAIYSRYPLIAARRSNPTPEHSVFTELEVKGERLLLAVTHPLPPTNERWFRSRNRQLSRLAQDLQTTTGPTLLVGDFNATMWSPYYRRFARQTNLQNARQGFGILPSWPTQRSFKPISGPLALLLSIPIDHCLHSTGLEVVNIELGGFTGSDHRPLIVDLAIAGA